MKSLVMSVGVLLLTVVEAMNVPWIYPESQCIDILQWYFYFEDIWRTKN